MYLNLSDKVVYAKIVYYGCGLGGKTTSLNAVYQCTDPEQKHRLVSLNTKNDRTLFFDLLPFELGVINGLAVRIKLFTVPGQPQYEITRRHVLSGADGVVFVADSQRDQAQANQLMIEELKSNLTANGLDPEAMPLVMQWNKRDLPGVVPVEEMERTLNFGGTDTFETVATEGKGVVEAFERIVSRTLTHLCRSQETFGERVSETQVMAAVEKTLGRFRPAGASAPPKESVKLPVDKEVFARSPDHQPDDPLQTDELLGSSVDTATRMAEGMAQLGTIEARADRFQREREVLYRFARQLTETPDPVRPYALALQAALDGTGLSQGSALSVTAEGKPLDQKAVTGAQQDPLNSVEIPTIGSVARTIAERGKPFLTHEPHSDLFNDELHPAVAGVRGIVAAPIQTPGTRLGLIILYGRDRERDLDNDDLTFLCTVADMASMAIMRNLLGRREAARKGA
jgi:signal recognition particle receptor subunit beta